MFFLGRIIGMFAASYYGIPLLTNQDFIIWDKGFFRLLLSNLMTFVEGWCFIRWDILTPRIPKKIFLPQITSWTSKKNLKEICSKNYWWNQNTTTTGMGWQKSHNFPKHSFHAQGRYVSFLDGDFGLVSIQSLQVRTWDFNRWISWTGEKSSTWKCSCYVYIYILLIFCYITKCNVYS